MKKYTLLTFIFLILYSSSINAQYIDTLEYKEDIYAGIVMKSIESTKAKRMSSKRGGHINTNLTNNIPDSLMISIEAAIEIWQCYMFPEDSLNIKISYAPLSSKDITTNVLYHSVDLSTYYPMALARNRFDLIASEIDAEITINSNTNWNVGIGTISSSAHNLTYALMRAIAKVMGFGSSLQANNRHGKLTFKFKPEHTIFDKLIFNDADIQLDSFSNISTTGLDSYVQPSEGSLYVYKKHDNYKLYAPEVFDNDKSLRYLTINNSLMSEQIPIDTLDLTIDNTTIDILRGIGWNITENDNVEIIGDGIDSTGITSAYQSHRFYLNATSSVTDHKWVYKLPLTSGGDTIVATSAGQDFIIPAITNANLYKHSIEGDIHGVIIFTGIINGIEVRETYNVTLELKPHIISAEIVERSDCTLENEFYSLTIMVKYAGAYNIKAFLEEEHSPWVTMYTSYIPYQTYLKINSIDGWGYAWIELSAENEFGEDTYIVELPNLLSSSKLKADSLSSKINIKSIEFDYDRFDYDIFYLINPTLKIMFEAKNVNNFMLKRWTTDDDTPYFESGGFDLTCIDNDTFLFENSGTGSYNVGDVIILKSDDSYSDTIFIDNYVEKDILDFWYATDGINNINSENDLSIKIVGKELIAETNDVCNLRLCNNYGFTIRQSSSNRINISSLSKGVYIIIARTNKETYIKKIIL